MHILVVGLGSMGKRRIRLTKALHAQDVLIGVDGNPQRCAEAAEELGIVAYASIDEAKAAQSIDCAYICTSPLSHAALIHTCLENGWHVFTEINLVKDGYEENMALAKEKGKVLFLSSTQFYSNEVRFMREQIQAHAQTPWNYVYHIGQYLPDWHPWESYKNFFIGDKRTNGCREIMAIEMPWLYKTFGKITGYQVLKSRSTQLDIDFDDNYLVLLEHENGNKGVLVVDVVSPVAIRLFEAYAENQFLSWNGTPESLKMFNTDTKTLESVTLTENAEHRDGYADFIVENDYTNELIAFFDEVEGTKPAEYDFHDDFTVLNIIDELEADA